MKSHFANTNLFKVSSADKKLFFGLFIVGLLFLGSYLLETTSLTEVLELTAFTELPQLLAYAAKALLLIHLVLYILRELARDD